MKFALVVLACAVAAANAQFNRASAFASLNNQAPRYQPFQPKPVIAPAPPARFAPAKSFVAVPNVAPIAPAPAVVVASAKLYNDARSAQILRYDNEVNPDGSYAYYYETDNGIAAQAQGTPRNLGGNPPVVPVVAQGSFSWTSPEGKAITINYVADENGYQPQGDAIPTPPPVPAQIARALEYIARSNPQIKK